ncbi:Protein of unknown function [Gryllus bimaculatus]|nr:Protein of unknown function [Gryllus bimaculatus]
MRRAREGRCPHPASASVTLSPPLLLPPSLPPSRSPPLTALRKAAAGRAVDSWCGSGFPARAHVRAGGGARHPGENLRPEHLSRMLSGEERAFGEWGGVPTVPEALNGVKTLRLLEAADDADTNSGEGTR